VGKKSRAKRERQQQKAEPDNFMAAQNMQQTKTKWWKAELVQGVAWTVFVGAVLGMLALLALVSIPWAAILLCLLGEIALIIILLKHAAVLFKTKRRIGLVILGCIMVPALVFVGFNFGKPTTIATNARLAENNSPQISPSISLPLKIPTFIDASQINPAENVTLQIGGIYVEYKWSDFQNGLTRTFNLAPGVPFKVWAENGRIYVDTAIYSGSPEAAPIEIHGTSFVVKPSDWDRNYNDYAFEVVNATGDPVFQFIYESQFHIVMYGIFPLPGGGLVWADKSGILLNPDPFRTFHLQRLFKYPSSKYLGQLADNSEAK
jgi:F0F1-type ATP synthase assembly protein I